MVGFPYPGFVEAGSLVLDGLRAGLAESGYIEGQTFKLEARAGSLRYRPHVDVRGRRLFTRGTPRDLFASIDLTANRSQSVSS